MRFSRTFLGTASAFLLATAAYAADPAISPSPDTAQDRITPTKDADSSLLTTKHSSEVPSPAAPTEALPWKSASDPATPVANAPAKPGSPFGSYQPASPFGHAEPLAPIIPDGPHATVAVPIVNVQSLEAPEAAPPTPVAAAADPAKEDPAQPTELTSPIFGDTATSTLPRKIVLRLLNKVTAQATELTFKPNETVKIGTLEITAITCQVSAPQSQTDYAALVDIGERSQDNKTVKPMFRGWMYASSPSITALEHPVYDVTMVKCELPETATKNEEKTSEKPVRKAKK